MKGHRFLSVALFFAAALLAAGDAHAGQTVGDIIKNVTGSWDGVANVFSTIAYLAGGFLGVAGIFKFKDHVDEPRQTPISAGVKRILAGGMFLSMPFMINATRGSLFGNAAVGSSHVKMDNFHTNALTPGGLDDMIVKFMADVATPIELLLTAFSYLAGVAFLLVGISRLTKRMEEGPRGPAGMGTIMTFIASGALFSFGDTMGVFTSSLFGNEDLMVRAEISTSVVTAADGEKIERVLEALMLFITLVGYIAFMRGWFVLRAFADGQQGATMAQGLTFLFGGTLAINLGELINALQETLGIAGALTFS